MANKTIVESIRDYIMQCPYLEDLAKIDINYLSEDSVNYSIEETPANNGGIVRRYIDGTTEREKLFVFACMFDYSEDLEQQIENSGFFENFQAWIESNNDNDILPELEDGKASEINVSTTGYTFMVSPTMDKARCQIQLQLLYDKEN